jgi:hypothetical protein
MKGDETATSVNGHGWNSIKKITAKVGTEGATENFLIWTDFGFCDRFMFISLISGRITMFYSAFYQDNSSAISDRARFTK